MRWGFDALNSNITWKLHNTVTGATEMSYPSNFSELMVTATQDNGENSLAVHILKDEITNHTTYRISGGLATAVANGYGINVNYDLTRIKLTWFFIAGVDNTSTATVKLYYR